MKKAIVLGGLFTFLAVVGLAAQTFRWFNFQEERTYSKKVEGDRVTHTEALKELGSVDKTRDYYHEHTITETVKSSETFPFVDVTVDTVETMLWSRRN